MKTGCFFLIVGVISMHSFAASTIYVVDEQDHKASYALRYPDEWKNIPPFIDFSSSTLLSRDEFELLPGIEVLHVESSVIDSWSRFRILVDGNGDAMVLRGIDDHADALAFSSLLPSNLEIKEETQALGLVRLFLLLQASDDYDIVLNSVRDLSTVPVARDPFMADEMRTALASLNSQFAQVIRPPKVEQREGGFAVTLFVWDNPLARISRCDATVTSKGSLDLRRTLLASILDEGMTVYTGQGVPRR